MFTVDKNACTGCGACIMACVDQFAATPADPAVQYRRMSRKEGVQEGKPFIRYTVLSCRHCINPLCMERCPAAAIYRQGDFIRIDQSVCTGCGACVTACVFRSIVMVDNQPVKCPGCESRVCESACPMGVIRWS